MKKRTVILNSLSSVTALITDVAVSFVMTPIIVHALGNQDYGIWELLLGLVGYLGLLELGIGPAILRHVADAWSRGDRDSLGRIFNTGFFTLASAGMIGLFIFTIGAICSEYVLDLTASENYKLITLLLLFGINITVTLPSTVLNAYLLGLQMHRFINLLRMTLTVIQALVIYQMISIGSKPILIWMALILLCKTIIQSLLIIFWILAVDRKVSIALSSFSIRTMKELISYGTKSMTITASVNILKSSVNFVIATLVDIRQIVYFSIPNRLVDYALSLSIALGFPLTPFFTDIAGKGDKQLTIQIWLQTTRVLQIFTIGIPLAVMGFGEPFIRIWIGQEYAERGVYVLYILCTGLFSQGIATNCYRVLLSLAMHGRLAFWCAILAPGSFLLSLGFGSSWGIEGVAFALTLYVTTLSILEIFLTCNVLSVPIFYYLQSTVLRFIVPISISITAIIGFRLIVNPRDYGNLLLQVFPTAILYLTVVWFFVLDFEERQFLKNTFLNSRKKIFTTSY